MKTKTKDFFFLCFSKFKKSFQLVLVNYNNLSLKNSSYCKNQPHSIYSLEQRNCKHMQNKPSEAYHGVYVC